MQNRNVNHFKHFNRTRAGKIRNKSYSKTKTVNIILNISGRQFKFKITFSGGRIYIVFCLAKNWSNFLLRKLWNGNCKMYKLFLTWKLVFFQLKLFWIKNAVKLDCQTLRLNAEHFSRDFPYLLDIIKVQVFWKNTVCNK